MLALALGMTVREMLAKLDSKELSEWAAYYSIEPFGYFRSDLQSGVIASTVANCNRTKSSRSFSPLDFMPIGEHKQQKVMSGDDIKDVFKGLAKEQAHGNSR